MVVRTASVQKLTGVSFFGGKGLIGFYEASPQSASTVHWETAIEWLDKTLGNMNFTIVSCKSLNAQSLINCLAILVFKEITQKRRFFLVYYVLR